MARFKIDFGMLFLLLSIGFLGMGLLNSLMEGEYFYTFICGISLLAWYIALITSNEEI